MSGRQFREGEEQCYVVARTVLRRSAFSAGKLVWARRNQEKFDKEQCSFGSSRAEFYFNL